MCLALIQSSLKLSSYIGAPFYCRCELHGSSLYLPILCIYLLVCMWMCGYILCEPHFGSQLLFLVCLHAKYMYTTTVRVCVCVCVCVCVWVGNEKGIRSEEGWSASLVRPAPLISMRFHLSCDH